MIPKIIHYCWLSSDPIPVDLQNYMNSWKKQLPDYVFIKWDFNRFPKDKSIWVSEAFNNKKYAFAADYIRLYALYNYGGIYLDMDVEVLKPFDEFLQLNTMLSYENYNPIHSLEVAAFGVAKNESWIGECLKYYDDRHFVNSDGSYNMNVLPAIVADCIKKAGFNIITVSCLEEAKSIKGNNIPVFIPEYFSPKNYLTGKLIISENTFSIHHFAASWMPWYYRVENKFWHKLGLKNWKILLRFHNLFKYGTIKSITK